MRLELVVLAIISSVCLVQSMKIEGNCHMDDEACEFSLEVTAWNTMRHLSARKVYISNTDGKVYFLGTNETVQDDEVIYADGHPESKIIFVVNKDMPGPALVMYENQNITVHVTNRLASESFSIHWHGLEVRGTPWMDGAAYVTQCPIYPGQTFTYNFMSGRKGTYFYHSHSTGLQNMGLVGALIIKERVEETMDEHVLMVQDYNNKYDNLDYHINGQFGTVNDDGSFFGGNPQVDGTSTTAFKFTSTLINGKGRIFENDIHATNTPLTVFRVQAGKRYRFRAISAAIALMYKLSIDGHTLAIVATDGSDTEPRAVDSLLFHSGERYDFVLNANNTVGNYWIRVESLIDGQKIPGLAILRYDGADESDPVSTAKACTSDVPCVTLGCATSVLMNHTCIKIEELRSLGIPTAPAKRPGKFKELFLNFALIETPFGVKGGVNGVIYSHPSVTALTQPKEVNGLCSDADDCGVDKICNCIQPINIDFGDVVQLNLLSMGHFSVLHHPIHLHGYSFHVLKTGYRLTNEAMDDLGNNPDVECGGNRVRAESLCNDASWANSSWAGGNIPDIDLAHAPRKDTVVVPAGGYAVVRFLADNPGLWFLHCHMEPHVGIGMGILLNDSFSHISHPPPGFPECRSFPPPSWVVEKSNGVDGQHTGNEVEIKDDNTFEPEVFWGIVGALLFVVLLQFTIMAGCLALRNGQKSKHRL